MDDIQLDDLRTNLSYPNVTPLPDIGNNAVNKYFHPGAYKASELNERHTRGHNLPPVTPHTLNPIQTCATDFLASAAEGVE